jgi:hypothetical protein
MACCPTMNPRLQMAFRAWGAITLTLALASGCADETGQFTAAEIDELCLQWCSPGPFSMCGGRGSDCYEDCRHGCNYEAGCEAPGVCTQHLAARNACRLDHMCAGNNCDSEAVLYLGCHAKTEFGKPLCPFVATCGVSMDACLRVYDGLCYWDWTRYLVCLGSWTNPDNANNQCDTIDCSDPCGTCENMLDHYRRCQRETFASGLR